MQWFLLGSFILGQLSHRNSEAVIVPQTTSDGGHFNGFLADVPIFALFGVFIFVTSALVIEYQCKAGIAGARGTTNETSGVGSLLKRERKF